MNEMARTCELDDLIEKRICDALRDGHSYAAAARHGGVSEATLHAWRVRGRNGEKRFLEFLERTDRADQEAEDRCLQVLKSAILGEDQRLATDTAWKWLARRRPEQWQEMKPVPEDKPLSLDEAKQILEAFQNAKAG